MSRRPSVQRQQREWEQRVAEQKAERARREAIAELGRFSIDADEHRLALIEQFGVSALRTQWEENRKAGAAGAQEHTRRGMADTLALAAKSNGHSARFVLYSEPRRYGGRTVLGDAGMGIEYTPRSPAVRRRQAERELRKLGIQVEYVNPNEQEEEGV